LRIQQAAARTIGLMAGRTSTLVDWPPNARTGAAARKIGASNAQAVDSSRNRHGERMGIDLPSRVV
jgi:hypothetical protein